MDLLAYIKYELEFGNKSFKNRGKYFMKIIIESTLNYNFEETNFVSIFEIYSFASKLA
jgi:hypothetical protein